MGLDKMIAFCSSARSDESFSGILCLLSFQLFACFSAVFQLSALLGFQHTPLFSSGG